MTEHNCTAINQVVLLKNQVLSFGRAILLDENYVGAIMRLLTAKFACDVWPHDFVGVLPLPDHWCCCLQHRWLMGFKAILLPDCSQ